MGIFENREYFEKLAKASDNRVDPHHQQHQRPAINESTAGPSSSAPDDNGSSTMETRVTNNFLPVHENDNDDLSEEITYQPAVASTSSSSSSPNRPSVLKKKPSNQADDASFRRLQIATSVLAWTLVFQLFYMVSVFSYLQPTVPLTSSKLLPRPMTTTPATTTVVVTKSMPTLNKVYIVGVFFSNVLVFIWMYYSVWTRHARFLMLVLVLSMLEFVAFLVVPILFFDPSTTTYRQCYGAHDCLRFTIPISVYFLTDLVLIGCFAVLVSKKIRQDSRTIRFNLTTP